MFERAQQGAVDVISGRSPMTREYIEDLTSLIQQCTTIGQPRLVLNLQDVPLIDSIGLELLVDTHEQCVHRGGVIHIAAPNPLCRDILRVTGLHSRFQVFEDVTAAVGSFTI